MASEGMTLLSAPAREDWVPHSSRVWLEWDTAGPNRPLSLCHPDRSVSGVAEWRDLLFTLGINQVRISPSP
jgi:hypothetical protein